MKVATSTDIQQTASAPVFNMHFIQNASNNVKNGFKLLIAPQSIFKLIGLALPNDYSLATSLAQARLAKIPEVKDFACLQHNKTVHMLAYINEPNEEAENKIYSVYGEMLDLFPNTNIDLKIVELYGRTREQVPLTNR